MADPPTLVSGRYQCCSNVKRVALKNATETALHRVILVATLQKVTLLSN
jgi:hypothetical protein